MKERHWAVMIIGAVSGVCFAVLAARALSDAVVTPRFRAYAVAYAIVAALLSYFAFRAATSGRTDEESFLRALWGGFAGAVVGLLILLAVYTMFRENARLYFARPLGLHLSQVTPFRLVAAFLGLGFAAGFALRTHTEDRKS